eukprot:724487-Prymnesium_polylepis.1
MPIRFRCMQYCREKLLYMYTPSRTPLHQPHPVTRRLQSSTALKPFPVYRSTRSSGYNLYIIPLGSCGPQATWDRASQGAPRFATVLAPGQRRLAPRDAAHDRLRLT